MKEALRTYYVETATAMSNHQDEKMDIDNDDIKRYEEYSKAKSDKLESKYSDISDKMYQNSKDYTGYSAGTSSAPSSSQPTSAARSTNSSSTQRTSSEIQENVKGDISQLPYSLEYIDCKPIDGESKMAMVAPKVLIRFDCPSE